MESGSRKKSYTVPCSSAFREEILSLARIRGVNAGDLARSVALVLPESAIRAYPDPGEPESSDRETVILKSGTAKGRPWRRKPRLQVRMQPGLSVSFVRRALAIANAMEAGEMTMALAGRALPGLPDIDMERRQKEEAKSLLRQTRDEIERLRAMIAALSFDPVPGGITSRDAALHVLGFHPGSIPGLAQLRDRFRALAQVHHPDGGTGNHDRMSQLNAAMDYLRRNVA